MSKHFIPIAANEDDDVPAFVPTAKPASERAHRLHGLGFGLAGYVTLEELQAAFDLAVRQHNETPIR